MLARAFGSIRQHGGDFYRHGVIAGLLHILGLGSIFVLHVLVARLLADSAQYGEYAWGQSLLFVLGGIVALGLPLATGRFVASLSATGAEPQIRLVILRAWQYLALSSAAIVAIAGLLALTRREAIILNLSRELILMAVSCSPCVAFFLLYQNLAKARRWLTLALLPSQVLRPLLTLALAAAVWWLSGQHMTGARVLLMVIVSIVIVTLAQLAVYHRRQADLTGNAGGTAPAAEFAPDRLLPTALPLLLTRVAALVLEFSSTLCVGVIAGPAAAGAYFAAERLARLAGIPQTVIEFIGQPRFAAAHATADPVGLQRVATLTAHSSLWPTLLLAALLLTSGESLLRLFGQAFAGAYPVLLVLLTARVIDVATGSVRDLLLMTGRQLRVSRVMGLAAVIHVLALVILTPLLGASGAALASVVSGLLANGFLLLLVRQELGVKPTVLATLAAGRPR